LFLLILVTFLTTCFGDCTKESLMFVANVSQPTKEWPHYWEKCVGSGHALLALRADFREQLHKTTRELGFKQIRFHGIFDDDMSVYSLQNGKPFYSFFNVDVIYDFLLSIGMKPIIELSFMPEDMASGNDTIFHYKGNITPPKNYDDWANLLIEFARHLIARYGLDEIRTWYFETWNEPNCAFWTGSQEDYWHLLKVTFDAIKSVDSQLKVGGPATCQSGWLSSTLAFCKANNVSLDFVSTHEYPTDVTPTTRGILKKVMTKARQEVGNMPLFYTEYNDGLYDSPPYHDAPFASAFAVFNALDLQGLPDLLSWWTFSDIFEEGGFDSTPFQGGYGLQNINGIPKPAYRAFELLHHSGTHQVSVTAMNTSATAGIIVTKTSNMFQIIAFNHNVPDAPIKTETLCITVSGVNTRNFKGADLHRIDDTHANAPPLWVKMGKPQYLTDAQIKSLMVASEMKRESIAASVGPNHLQFSLDVPPQGVAAISFSL